MAELSKTNISGTKNLRFELDKTMFINWLNDLVFNGAQPYALYFELKRKTSTGMVNLDHIEIVPVYLTQSGNVRKPTQALTLAIATTGVTLFSFPNGSAITSIPTIDKPDYRALEQFVDRVGFVMFGFHALQYMISNSTKVFISSMLFDPRSFQYNSNPENEVNYPIYTLKVEIEPISTTQNPQNLMDNLYPPYLVGTPCAKRWYDYPS